MAKFKIGDRVIGNSMANDRFVVTQQGWVGEVTRADNKTFSAYGKMSDAHSLNFEGLGYDFFDLVQENQSIHLTTQDRTIHAVLKQGNKVIKRAKATCSPQDEFNFEFGAKLAVNRLFGTEKKEVKEVNRPAKVGEWVKATSNFSDEIKKGVIKQVKAIYGNAIGVEGITKALGDGY